MASYKNIALILICLQSLSTFGQNQADALRIGLSESGLSTGRSAGMAGSFGALGGDFSALVNNPAGLAVYRKSEIIFSPGYFYNTQNSTYLDSKNKELSLGFTAKSLGYVGIFENKSASRWVNMSVALGYNQMNRFNKSTFIEGYNSNTSYIDELLNDLKTNNVAPDQIATSEAIKLETAMAWDTYLIDTVGNDYYSSWWQKGQMQRLQLTESGKNNVSSIAFGGNYNNKLYIGATFSNSNINYTSKKSYTEQRGSNDTLSVLNSFTLSEKLTTTGNGFDFKVGAIYRLNDVLRFGAYAHAPTLYNLKDAWTLDLGSTFDVYGDYDATTVNGAFDYTILTPGKLGASAAIMLKKAGAINIDYEYVDYTTMKMRGGVYYDFAAENAAIKSDFQAASTLKIGIEARKDPIRYRVGYAYSSNPYSASSGINGESQLYSAGVGYRKDNFYIDVAFFTSKRNSIFTLYDQTYSEPAKLSASNSQLLVTLGFKFE